MSAITNLITNSSNIIRFLKEFSVDSAKDVSVSIINADGSESKRTFPNVAKQIAGLESWKNTFLTNKEYLKDTPLTGNMITNPLFLIDGEKSLSGWNSGGSGIDMEVMHPYTRGFASPYVADSTDAHVDNKIEATEENPFWAGRYRSFGGAINFSGASNSSLNAGWDKITGNILKITYDGSASSSAEFFFTTLSQHFGLGKYVKFSAFIFVEKGTLFMGNHAGYNGNRNNSLILTQKHDWEYVEFNSGVTDVASGNNRKSHQFGFDNEVESIVYIAIPNLVLMNKGDGKIISIRRT